MTVKKIVAKKPVKTTRTIYIGFDVDGTYVDNYDVSTNLVGMKGYDHLYSIEIPIIKSETKVVKLKVA